MSGVALVTGLGSPTGIAAAVARALVADRWQLLATGWTAYHGPGPGVVPLLGELQRSGAVVQYLETDLQEEQAPSSLFDSAERLLGPVDALVTLHAHWRAGRVDQTPPEEFDRHYRVNARATFLLCAEFAKRWCGQPGTGRIVNFVSGSPLAGEAAYAASKGAVVGLTLAAAAELAPRGISVNALDPGPVDTGWMGRAQREDIARRAPAGRPGRPEEVASLVRFLCSPAGERITGQVLRCDGGWSTLR